MADGGQNLEELVRRIVSSVHNLTESSNTVVSGNNAGGSGNTSNPMVNNVADEINQRFLLPRASTSTVTTATATGFNANNDYSYPNYRSRPRQRNPPHEISRQRTPATQRTNFSRRGSRRARERSETSTLKEVILLPRPTHSKVPKYRGKLNFQECGLISDGCAFDRSSTIVALLSSPTPKDFPKELQTFFEASTSRSPKTYPHYLEHTQKAKKQDRERGFQRNRI